MNLNRFKPFAFLLPLTLSVQLFAQNKLPEIKVDAAPLVRTPQNSFAPIVEKVAPSVVTISISEMRRVDGRTGRSPFFDDPLFRELFKDLPRPKRDDDNVARKRVEIGMGSGVIVSPDGYILTNNHVIEAGDEIVITMADGKTKYTAKKIGGDPGSDIAVVKVDATGLPAATFANSDQVKVGDLVLAIGNPFALRQSVSMGIVSATGRRQRELAMGGINAADAQGAQFSNSIQTDAAINPGNSGGALVDAEGRLIGINSSILSRTGVNMGIGFAVPSNQARSVMEGLIKFGRVQRGFLGINELQDLNEKLAKEFKVPVGGGVLVADIREGAPAAKSGIKNGDVIVELNGQPVTSTDAFIRSIQDLAPGTLVKLKIVHKGETREVPVTLGERPPESVAENDPQRNPPTPDRAKPAPAPGRVPDLLDRVSVADIRPEYRAQFGIPENVRGALVTEVEPESPCAGEIKAGDVIVEIDDKAVKDADDAVKISEQVKTKSTLRLRVNTRGATRFVIIEETK